MSAAVAVPEADVAIWPVAPVVRPAPPEPIWRHARSFLLVGFCGSDSRTPLPLTRGWGGVQDRALCPRLRIVPNMERSTFSLVAMVLPFDLQ